jgi:Tfp pilus assembly protein PilE
MNVRYNQSKAARACGGFTLVEAVFAILAAAVMLIALYASFTTGFSILKVTREDLRATQIILDRMERVRLSPYTQLANQSVYPASLTETNGPGGVAYTVTFTTATNLESMPPDIDGGYKSKIALVTVKVSWKSGNVLRERSMQTYVARDGIQSYISR